MENNKKNLTGKRREALGSELSSQTSQLWQQGKDFFLKGISPQAEISSLKTELQNLSPQTQDTFQTLISNARFQKEIALNQQDALLAQIAAYAYLPPEKRPYQIWDFYLEPIYNSIFHCIYLNHQQKICIIWYRGTDFTNKEDLFSDIQIILGVNAIDPRVRGSLEIFDQLRKSHGHYQKRICGHSLGGTLCYIVAKHREVDYCCTFNPWSAPNKIFILMLKDTLIKKTRTQKIHTYKILWDPISLFSYVGETISFFLPSMNLKKLHSMDNFFKIE